MNLFLLAYIYLRIPPFGIGCCFVVQDYSGKQLNVNPQTRFVTFGEL